MKHQFYRKCGIPNCVGAIDGTLIPIQAPIEHEEIYVCRKNFHAINAQGVVDDKGRYDYHWLSFIEQLLWIFIYYTLEWENSLAEITKKQGSFLIVIQIKFPMKINFQSD